MRDKGDVDGLSRKGAHLYTEEYKKKGGMEADEFPRMERVRKGTFFSSRSREDRRARYLWGGCLMPLRWPRGCIVCIGESELIFTTPPRGISQAAFATLCGRYCS